MNPIRHDVRNAFSLIELLVVIGITAILLSLIAPSLARARGQGLEAKTASNLRQLAVGLHMYADSNRDLPPTFSEPFWPEPRPWRFDFGTVGDGIWFDHAFLYSLALTPLLGDTGVAAAPGNPTPYPAVTHRGVVMCRSDFMLTYTLYAEPAFFNWDTQRGLSQFGAQRLSRIAFPSDKGLLWPPILYCYPQYGRVPGCCQADLKTPIAFADTSVSSHVMKSLRPGIVNLFAHDHVIFNIDPRTVQGGFVASTIDGVLGRDR